MEIKLVHIGFGNLVVENRIISISSPESLPIRRLIQKSRREGGLVIDATSGRRIKSIILADPFLILSHFSPTELRKASR